MEEGQAYPKLRNLDIFPAEVSGQKVICLRDPLNLSGKLLFIPVPAFYLINLFDGRHSIADIQADFMRRFGELLYHEKVQEFIDHLDAHFLLESERYRLVAQQIYDDFKKAPTRPAVLAGESYESDSELLQKSIQGYFQKPEGPGDPSITRLAGNLMGAVAPHIDYRRGGSCYAFAHKAIRESCDADLFLILGTAHSPTKLPFVLTRKHFETPWGLVETDHGFLSEFEKGKPPDFYEDEFVHKQEHSIELQLIFLRALWTAEKPLQIVPVLCGSFHEAIRRDISPLELPGVTAFFEGIRGAIAASAKKICVLASADLAHVGVRFGDPEPPNRLTLRFLEDADQRMLGFVQGRDAEGFYEFLRGEQDRRKICGFSPIYTLLHLIQAGEGKLLNYQQAVEANSQSVVTFASLAFYG
jgi:MEMO1 family protein